MNNVIQLKEIQKYYKVGKDKLHVLKSVNLSIKQGEFVMIMGKSGSGKTTGFVFQQFNLVETLNIYQNVELPMIYNNKYSKEERKERIEKNLELVGLLDKTKQRPLQLSGGQQQRIAIARALVNDPQIIFADEPTGALDSDTGFEIMNLLKQFHNQGKTIIMVTHDADLTEYATKIIKLKDGVIIEGV